ncbi:MAG: WecB/TagA/CpsF family glycosyltransferase [Patescibacteria group bacterium]
MPLPNIYLLGTRIDAVNWEMIERFCQAALIQGAPKVITTINGEIVLMARKNPAYRQILNRADLAIPDSINVVWVARLKGAPLRRPTPGVELVERLCRIAADMQKSVYFLGSQNGAGQKAAEALVSKFDDLEVAGVSEAGPEDPATAAEVRRKNPDIVFVGYGAPRQEQWINQYKEQTTAKILVGVGGSFDIIAGVLPRAPQLMRRLHLEWLWRLWLQPKRLWRIIKAVIVFPLLALFNKS